MTSRVKGETNIFPAQTRSVGVATMGGEADEPWLWITKALKGLMTGLMTTQGQASQS